MALILTIAFFLVSNIDENGEEEFHQADIVPIKNFLDSCVKDISEDAVYLLGWRGGLIEYDESRMMFANFEPITYSYIEGRKTLPTTEEMELELENYVNEYFDGCIENGSILQGWDIEKGDIDSEASMSVDSVLFKINYPLNFVKGDYEERLSEFKAEVPVRLLHIRSVIENIVDEQLESPGLVPYTLLDRDLDGAMYLQRENNFIYEFIDDKSIIRNEPFQFLVANRFQELTIDDII